MQIIKASYNEEKLKMSYNSGRCYKYILKLKKKQLRNI